MWQRGYINGILSKDSPVGKMAHSVPCPRRAALLCHPRSCPRRRRIGSSGPRSQPILRATEEVRKKAHRLLTATFHFYHCTDGTTELMIVANAQLMPSQCNLACESGPDADVVAAIRVDRSLAEVAALLLPLEGTSWVSLTNTLRLWG